MVRACDWPLKGKCKSKHMVDTLNPQPAQQSPWQAEHSNNDEEEEHPDECCCHTVDSTQHNTTHYLSSSVPRLSDCCFDCESLLSLRPRGDHAHSAIHCISARTARWWFTV